MKNLVQRWVHESYSRDLQELGYKPTDRSTTFDAYLLLTEDWAAFQSLYDPPPELFEAHPLGVRFALDGFASRIFDLLVGQVGALESDRDQFRDQFLSAHVYRNICTEFRFCGSLGFGGKFWVDAGRWYVTCYSEDETPDRCKLIDATNAALAALKAEHKAQHG